ncbi:hypothetical protein CEXT_788301 [Caerostris extrusa]|uniref:Uncharacterized protein n=1 Tax=Caerostris extrusa TaxID=172846 RepID=A0AAV4WM06_CAEEX|nr:hypothetical protein CEXT_788301 [Caerostris extrusa]
MSLLRFQKLPLEIMIKDVAWRCNIRIASKSTATCSHLGWRFISWCSDLPNLGGHSRRRYSLQFPLHRLAQIKEKNLTEGLSDSRTSWNYKVNPLAVGPEYPEAHPY